MTRKAWAISSVFTLAFVALVVFAIIFSNFSDVKNIKPQNTQTQKIIAAKNYNDIMSILKNNTNMYTGRNNDLAEAPQEAATGEKDSLDSGSKADDHTNTNTQVKGVDEADIIKTDGNFIFTLSGNRLTIVNAVPANEMKVLATITADTDSYFTEFFLRDDNLILISNMNAPITDKVFRSGMVKVDVYNVTDHSKPVLKNGYSVDGYYQTSRMIEGNIYVVTNYYVYTEILTEPEDVIPRVALLDEEMTMVPAKDIYIMNTNSNSFVTVSGFNTEDYTAKPDVSVCLGSGMTVYSSLTSLYIASVEYNYTYGIIGRGIAEDTVAVEKPAAESSGSSSSPIEPDKAVAPDQKPDYVEVKPTQTPYREVKPDISKGEKTVIMRFDISNSKVKPIESKVTIPGYVINQFAMDEYNGYFRVATTWNNYMDRCSNVYVVSKDTMKVVGLLEGLAPSESIYSVRYKENICYIVTYRQMDPLFTIDLSNPSEPVVKGELKIPGFSNYLHPWKDGLMIGIGQESVESPDSEFGIPAGLKLSLFDVSDINNPKEIKKLVLGYKYSNSSAEYDHKAFMVNAEKGIIGIPANLLDDKYNNLFSGFLVFKVDENGFTQIGSIKQDDYMPIVRGVMVRDNLYTMSYTKLVASTLDGKTIYASVDIADKYYYGYYDKGEEAVDDGVVNETKPADRIDPEAKAYPEKLVPPTPVD